MKGFFVTAAYLLLWMSGGFLVGLWISLALRPPLAAQLVTSASAIPPEPTSAGRLFSADAGIMLKFVRPERAADFEATIERLREALDISPTPRRREQALGWRVFRASERATNGDLVYVFLIEPAVRGADYATSKILAEAFPQEAQSLDRRYAESSQDQAVLDLSLVAALGQQPSR